METNQDMNRRPPARPLAKPDHGAAATSLTPAVLDAAMARGRRERAEEAARLGRALLRGLARTTRTARRGLEGLGRRLERRNRRRAAQEALLQVPPRLLDDVGLTREQVRSLVDGVLTTPGKPASPRPEPVRPAAAAAAGVHRLAA